MAVGSLESVAALYRAEALTHLNEIEVGISQWNQS